MPICRVCHVELNNGNWSPSNIKNNNKICKSCIKEYNKKYRKSDAGIESSKRSEEKRKGKVNSERAKAWRNKNPEKAKEYRKLYRENNKEKIKTIVENYYSVEKNIEKRRKRVREYYKTTNGKNRILNNNDKRNRNLERVNLNEYFPNSHGHHINNKHVIYIPKELNQNIKHNVKTGYNMEQINTIAFFFLLMNNIKELSELFGG